MRVYFCLSYLSVLEGFHIKSKLTFEAVFIDKPDISVTTMLQGKSAAQCSMECLEKAEECIAFTYDASTVKNCYLYGRISSIDTIGTEVFAVSMPVALTKKKELGLFVLYSLSKESCICAYFQMHSSSVLCLTRQMCRSTVNSLLFVIHLCFIDRTWNYCELVQCVR